jgi:hypothetical protein
LAVEEGEEPIPAIELAKVIKIGDLMNQIFVDESQANIKTGLACFKNAQENHINEVTFSSL